MRAKETQTFKAGIEVITSQLISINQHLAHRQPASAQNREYNELARYAFEKCLMSDNHVTLFYLFFCFQLARGSD